MGRDRIFSGSFDTVCRGYRTFVDGSKTDARRVSSDTLRFALLIPHWHKTSFKSDNETHDTTWLEKGGYREICGGLTPRRATECHFSIDRRNDHP